MRYNCTVCHLSSIQQSAVNSYQLVGDGKFNRPNNYD
jgi:hypothetical protein